MNNNKNKIEEIRSTLPQKIADELCSVQPMPQHIDWEALVEDFTVLQAVSGHQCVHDPLNHAKQE